MENTLTLNHEAEQFYEVFGITKEREIEMRGNITVAFEKQRDRLTAKKSEMLEIALNASNPQNLNEYLFITFNIADMISRASNEVQRKLKESQGL